jgi:multiple sugar transport system substrate-binding protein
MVALAACGGGSSTPTSTVGKIDPNKQYSITFWEAFATGANKTALDGLTQQYMSTHSNIKVTLQAYPDYTTLQTKLKAAIAANSGIPAISQLYEEWATQFQQANAIVSLQPFISGPNGLSSSDLADFYPSLLNDGQINGAQYMLPFNKSDIALYYNVDMLQKLGLSVPKTLADFETDITKAKTGGNWGLSYTPDVDYWSILYRGFGGGSFVSADGKSSDFDTSTNKPLAVKALGELAPLVKSGAIHVTTGFNWQNDFASGKSLFAVSTIASYPFIATAVKNAFKFDEAALPAGPSGQFTVVFGTNLSIYSGVDADSQAAAWDYMKYLTGATADASFVQQTGYMPVRQSAFNSSDLQNYYTQVPARKVGPQSLSFAFVASTVPAWDQCRTVISTDFVAALKGQLTPAAAESKMATDCNSALAAG